MNFPPACHSHSQSRLAAPQSRENKNWAYHITCPLLYAHVYRKTQSLKLYCGNYRIPTRLPPGADTLFEITQSHLSNCQQWQHTLANLDLLSKGQKSLLFKRTSLKHTMKHYNSRLTLYSYETHLHWSIHYTSGCSHAHRNNCAANLKKLRLQQLNVFGNSVH